MMTEVYTLFSSSKGNSAYFKNGDEEFLIDCGASARATENALASLGTSLKNIKAVFITHEHSDHISGLKVIEKNFGLPVYAPAPSIPYIADAAGISAEDIIPLVPKKPVVLNNFSVCPVATPHDSLSSVGFRIKTEEGLIGYFTDIGHLSEDVLRALSGCGRVIIESNHDIGMLKNGIYPEYLKSRILGDRGHLSNAVCAKLLPHLAEHGTSSFLLAHLSRENNLPELAFNESYRALAEKGIKISEEGGDVHLAVAAISNTTKLP